MSVRSVFLKIAMTRSKGVKTSLINQECLKRVWCSILLKKHIIFTIVNAKVREIRTKKVLSHCLRKTNVICQKLFVCEKQGAVREECKGKNGY